MSTVVKREISIHPGDAELAPSISDAEWVHKFSEAMAYGYGYTIDVELSDALSTSETSLSLTDHKIKVRLSQQLIERAEAEDQLDFLGFNILHELGHVKRFGAEPPEAPPDPNDAYFQNIVDDIAINFDNARKTRFFADLTSKAYDQYLFPIEKRTEMTNEPKHKQFMEALLLVSMTTSAHRKPLTERALQDTLEGIGCTDIAPDVMKKLSQVVNYKIGMRRHNLLGQIREYGEDLPYYNQLTSCIRNMYDELYEEDLSDIQQQPSNLDDSGDANPSITDQFDYSNSGGCQHTTSPEHKDTVIPPENDSTDTNKGVSSKSGDQADDIAEVGKQIGKQIAETIDKTKDQTGNDQEAPQLSAEKLARLRQELGLDESDFQGFLATVNKYRREIDAISDLILQLRRERQDNFLAPSHEVSARGHRIHVGKLLGYLASGSVKPTPDIWKTPSFLEKTEYEFDGADFYFVGDVSLSMAGPKAMAAAESAVVLSQGIQDASLEYYEDVPPIRIQIQAFGSEDQTLCMLTNSPSNTDLGRMYSSLLKPNSNNTQVSGALAKIKPAKNRLSVIMVLSDGQFYDESFAIGQGERLEGEGAVIVQCIFGKAQVSNLSNGAKRMNLYGAQDLPSYLFGIMPELIDILRSTTHA